MRSVPDFPTPGILFRDIGPVLEDAQLLADVIHAIAYPPHEPKVDVVIGIESRGFIVGAAVALARGCGFVPVRKAGKLPPPTYGVDYELEYGKSRLEIAATSLLNGRRALIVDDVLATGGTSAAAGVLASRCGAEVVGVSVLIELTALKGKDRLGVTPVASVLSV